MFDSHGTKITTLAVGENYVPGTPLYFGAGLSASFNLGDLSKSAGQVMSLDAVADSLTLAQKILDACFEDKRVQNAKVRVEKLHALKGAQAAGVEIEQSRS